MPARPTAPSLTFTTKGLTGTAVPVAQDLYEVTVAGKVRGSIGVQPADGFYPGKPYTQHLNLGENFECGDTFEEALEDFVWVYAADPSCLNYV